jgi:predicted ATP-grasp superfamily ATP-dependent carboligase
MRTLLVGVSTRAIAESARRAGHDVVTIDFFGDLDQKKLCENRSLRECGLPYSAATFLELARGLSYDAVAYVGSLENHPSIVAELSQSRVLLGNPPRTLEAVRDPARLFSLLEGGGFSVPAIVQPGDLLPVTGTWLRKPVRSGGGQGIRAWRGQQLQPGQILEEYIDGVPASASFVADGRRASLLGVTRQLHEAHRFRYEGNIFPLKVPSVTADEIRAIADVVTDAFELRGVNGFDFVLRGARPVLVEVNPRYSASMELIERATGLSIFDVHLAGCERTLPHVAGGEPERYWGKRIVYARTATRVGATGNWLERGMRDVPHPGESFRRGQPICTVLASGPSPETCERQLNIEMEAVLADCSRSAADVRATS